MNHRFERLRYAPETATVELILDISKLVRDVILAVHPGLLEEPPSASSERLHALALLRACERIERDGGRYLEATQSLASSAFARTEPRQTEMF